MHDFNKFVYLDLQKTGSSYVSKFLQACCILTEKKFKKHGFIREDYDSSKFYFITVRHPLSIYSSLYRYGLGGRGEVRHKLAKTKNLSAYSSFDSFIDFCLDENNAHLLGYGYTPVYAKHIGFVSFRFLKLSLQFPHKKINHALRTEGGIKDLESQFITNLEIKNEHLNSGLKELATEILPDYFQQDAAIEFLNNSPKINSSKTNSDNTEHVSDAIYAKFRSKEQLLLSRY